MCRSSDGCGKEHVLEHVLISCLYYNIYIYILCIYIYYMCVCVKMDTTQLDKRVHEMVGCYWQPCSTKWRSTRHDAGPSFTRVPTPFQES